MLRASAFLLALLCTSTATGCGEETPKLAVYELAHGLEHEDAEEACDRLFSGALLPAGIAGPLDTVPGNRSPSTWARERDVCVRDLGRAGSYASTELDRPLVQSIRQVAIAPEDGITAAALARVRLNYGPPTTVRLVEFRGVWRVVLGHGGEITDR